MEDFNIKEFNKSIRESIAIKALETKPYLMIIQVGDNPASNIYVKNKIKACYDCNIKVDLNKLEEDVAEKTLLSWIRTYNMTDAITGIIVQMPLPRHINPLKVCETINPNKDVDGFNPINVGKHALGEKNCFIPATVKGVSLIIHALGTYSIFNNNLRKGANCVIIGRSNIVGKPMAYEMINTFSCTTTICNSYTDINLLKRLCSCADIIICAVGKSHFITKEMFTYGDWDNYPIVIDVGINRLPDGKVVGDCDYEGIKDYCSYITPVPGGVGPLTITGLLHNVAYYKDYQI